MKKVKIINGTYGHRPKDAKFVTPVKTGEVVEVSDTEAARLVGLKVAAWVGEAAECGETGEAAALDIVDGRFAIESLMELTRPHMERLAASLGVDVSKCKNKSEIAEMLAAIEIAAGAAADEDAPPELGADLPVL